ncbi:MAG: hypothetical protein FDX02_08980 [Chlorobium sp.]|nr:MAG: hypothetical protein FDX02_08980 [Chlorobium sp.]
MKTLVFFLEEPSAQRMLEGVLPRLLVLALLECILVLIITGHRALMRFWLVFAGWLKLRNFILA